MLHTDTKRPDDRAHTLKPALLGGNIRDKAGLPKGLKPGEKQHDNESILDELEFRDSEPKPDLNREQQ